MIFEIVKSRLLRLVFVLLSGSALLPLTSCTKSPPPHSDRPQPRLTQMGSARTAAASEVLIDYPPQDQADPLDLRSCSLSGVYDKMPCRLIGTSGHIRKITWMDDTMNVVEASIEFDPNGKLEKICRRGHVDFQSWHCSVAPFSSHDLMAQTKLDERGRIIQQQHFQFDATRLDTCRYDDLTIPRTSECVVDGFSLKYTFDKTGRSLTYSVRRIPVKGESDETTNSLGKAYAMDLTFIYKDDARGNWTEFEVAGRDKDSGLVKRYSRQTLSIEYY